MRILGIRFCNLNSLKGEFEIRFDRSPLSDSGLFAITGPTGAGKTTLLDAITVALYNRVPRHDKDVSELMSRHTGECWSEVEFESHGIQYRAKWSLRRARGKADGKLQTDDMELSLVDTGAILGGHKKKETLDQIVAITGLDYEQFLRSVLLAQGEFTRFLKASANERSQLLEQMTETSVFSNISVFVYEKHKTEKQILETMNQVLGQIVSLSEDEVTNKSMEKEAKENEAKALRMKEAEARENIGWLQKLAQLKAEGEALANKQQALNNEKLDAKPWMEKLAWHHKALPALGRLQLIQAQETEKEKLEKESQIKQGALPALEMVVEHSKQAHLLAGEALRKAEVEKAGLQPVIEATVKLDLEIQRLDNDLAKKIAQKVHEEGLLKDAMTALEAAEASEKQGTDALQQVHEWLKAQAHWSTLPEVEKLYLQDAVKFGHLQQQEQTTAAALLTLGKQIENAGKMLAKGAVEKSTLAVETSNALKQKEAVTQQLEALLQGSDAELLQQTADEWPGRIALGKRLVQLSEDYVRLIGRVQNGESKIEELAKDIVLQKHEQTSAQALLDEAKQHLAALEKTAKQQLLIRKYEADRHLLAEGEACPLCGATDHPFAGGVPDSAEEAAEVAVMAQKQKISALEAGQTERAKAIAASQGRMHEYVKATDQLREEATSKQALFEAGKTDIDWIYAIADTSHMYAAMETWTQTWQALQANLVNIRKQQAVLQGIEQQYAAASHAFELQEASIKTWEAERLQWLQQQDQLLTQQKSIAHEMQGLHQQLNALLQPVGLAFEAQNLETLKATLHEQKNRYAEKQKAMQDYQQQSELAKQQKQSLSLQAQALRQRVESIRHEETEAEKMLFTLKAERRALFADKQTRVETLRLEQAIEQARQTEKDTQQKMITAGRDLDIAQRDIANMTTQLDRIGHTLSEHRVQLQTTAKALGFADNAALSAALLSEAEAHQLDKKEKELVTREQHLQSLAVANQQQINATEALAKTTHDIQYWEDALQQMEAEEARLLQQLGALQNELAEDARRKKQFADKLAEQQLQQQTVTRWKQLSDLIGSADGNKFRMFAQGLTLQQLALLANRHLSHFSPRYSIAKMPGDNLELEIQDAWQAGVARPISTLSGGETFLVSLSLALGLSDLASKKVQIQSLFIDEGFGTLDAETLDTAMDALENLQMQGKTIGIISHVEALKDRIGTQIQVRKQAGGHSSIRVLGL